MTTNKTILEEIKYLKKELEKREIKTQELYELREKYSFLNIKHMSLNLKYQKLEKDYVSKETKRIVYNGELYNIREINFCKKPEEVDSIVIEAVKAPTEKGLVNNLSDTFKEIGEQLNKIMFGDTNE